MTKLIVETTGPFMLMLGAAGEVPHNRPAVVSTGSGVDQQIAIKALKVLAGDLPDEANDADFAGFFQSSEGDVPLAIEAYVSTFATGDSPDEKAEAAAAKAAKKAAKADAPKGA